MFPNGQKDRLMDARGSQRTLESRHMDVDIESREKNEETRVQEKT